jgi:outer membrane protein assembly factor BamB
MRIPGFLLCSVLAVAGQAAQDPEALFEAARTGDRAAVVRLLDSGVDVNAATRYGVTALGFAADKGHLDIVKLLVERGANLDVTDAFYGSRPVDFARRGGHKAVIDFLAPLTAEIRKTADAARRVSLNPSQLGAFEGRYQSASTGAALIVAVTNGELTLAADGQPTLQLRAVEERRFTAAGTPDLTVTFAGRGGMIERLVITRGTSSLRYEREGYGDATSPAPAPVAPATSASARSKSEALTPTRAKPAPWPAFRGANAAGAADGQGAVAEWDVATGKNILWKTPIAGLAISSPIIWGDRVFVVGAASDQDKSFRTGLYGDVKPVDDLSTHSWRVYSLDRKTGKVVWEREIFSGAPQTKRHTKSSQANSTPVTDGRHIVAVFGSIGSMVCFDMDGKLLWKKDVGTLNSGWFLDPTYQWGHSSSPVIYKSSVIVQADQARGSFLAAFNLADGREVWRTARTDEVSTWGTPTILNGKNGDELVTNGTKVRGYDPATGRLLWTLGPNSEIAIGTPVVRGDMVYVTAGYPPVRPVYAIRAGARGDISLPTGQSSSAAIAWSHDRDGTYISSPIVYRDILYTLNNNGIFTAYDATSGERLYRARVGGGGAFSASPIAADGKIYMASEDGDVFIVQAGREYVELAKHPMGEVIMASPAISDGVLVIRTLGHVWGIGSRN